MSYILYLCYNDNISEEARLFILNRLKEIKGIENRVWNRNRKNK